MKKVIKIFVISFLLAYPTSLVFSAGKNQISINGGERSVDSRVVDLDINIEKNIDKISISNSKDFAYSSRQEYKKNIEWDLCSRYSGAIKLPVCDDGEYIVYVKLYNKSREEVEVVSAKVILLSVQKKEIVNNNKIEIKKDSDNTKNIESIVLASTYSETLEFDGVKFVRNLRVGSSGSDVKALQKFFNNNNIIVAKSGVGSPGKETSYFGNLSVKALTSFQKKYSNEIKTNNFGVLDKATRDFINSIGQKIIKIKGLKKASIIFSKDLKKGLSSSDVKVLQKFLNNNNIIVAESGVGSSGKETDYFGNLSVKALTLFQKKYSSEINTNNFGVLDKLTRDFINSIGVEQKKVVEKVHDINLPSPVFGRNFGIEAKGEDVRRMQQLLASNKTFYPEGIVSGYFGRITEKAVKRFQDKYDIVKSSHPAYGYVGPATRAKLKEVFSNS